MFGKGVPEGGGRDGEGSVTPGSVVCSACRGKEVSIGRTEVTGGSVPMEEVR